MAKGKSKRKASSATTLKNEDHIDGVTATTKKRVAHTSKSSEADIKKPKLAEVMDISHLECGTVLAVGTGDMGQLGLGEDLLLRKKPAIVKKLQDHRIRFGVAGGIHTCCLTDDNKLFTFGCNDEDALGRPTTEDGAEYEPALITAGPLSGKKICQISAGDSHTAVLTSDGDVYIWGSFRDGHGTMGLLQPKETCKEPKQVSVANEIIVQLASGSDHLLMLSVKGHVYSFGRAEQGQLGRISRYFCDRASSRDTKKSAEAGAEATDDSSNTGGGVNRTKGTMLLPQRVLLPKGKGRKRVAGGVTISKIFCGSFSSYAISTEDEVFAWGLNNYNQLGIADAEVKFHPVYISSLSSRGIQEIAAGEHHSIFLTDEGKVYALGRGCYGRLGLGESVTQADVPTQIPQLFDIASISAKDSVAYAVNKDGAAFGWGFGTNSQLTDGEAADQWTPIRLTGRQLEDKRVIRVSCGSQHCVLIVA